MQEHEGDQPLHKADTEQPNQESENRHSAATDMQDETAPADTHDARAQAKDDNPDTRDAVDESSEESFPASDSPAWR